MNNMKCFINIDNRFIINEIKRINGIDYNMICNFIPCDRVEDILEDLIKEYGVLEEKIEELTTLHEPDPHDEYMDYMFENEN